MPIPRGSSDKMAQAGVPSNIIGFLTDAVTLIEKVGHGVDWASLDTEVRTVLANNGKVTVADVLAILSALTKNQN